MPCYQCGSPHGAESVLCPDCRADRAKDTRPLGEKVLSDYRFTWRAFFKLIFGDTKRVFIVFVFCAIPLAYYLIANEVGPKYFSQGRRIGRRCISHSTNVASIRASGGDLSSGVTNRFLDTGEVAQALIARFGEVRAQEMLMFLVDGQTTLCRDFQKLCLEEGRTEFCEQLDRGLR